MRSPGSRVWDLNCPPHEKPGDPEVAGVPDIYTGVDEYEQLRAPMARNIRTPSSKKWYLVDALTIQMEWLVSPPNFSHATYIRITFGKPPS